MHAIEVKIIGSFFLTFTFILNASLSVAQIPVMVQPENSCEYSMVYLDSLLHRTSKEKSVFYTRCFNIGDQDVWSTRASWRRKGYKLIWAGANPGSAGNPVPLDGIAEWYKHDMRRLVVHEEFRDGWDAGLTMIYGKKSAVKESTNYDKKWQHEKYSFYTESYFHGEVIKGVYHVFDSVNCKWIEVCAMGCQTTKDLQP